MTRVSRAVWLRFWWSHARLGVSAPGVQQDEKSLGDKAKDALTCASTRS